MLDVSHSVFVCFQRGEEGDLMRCLSAKVKDVPAHVLSAIVVESAARFKDDSVVQLLHPQSAVGFLLLRGTSFIPLIIQSPISFLSPKGCATGVSL